MTETGLSPEPDEAAELMMAPKNWGQLIFREQESTLGADVARRSESIKW